MKKQCILIPLLVLFLACTSGENQSGDTQDKADPETESIEKSSDQLEKSIQETEAEFKETDKEIDSLLNAI